MVYWAITGSTSSLMFALTLEEVGVNSITCGRPKQFPLKVFNTISRTVLKEDSRSFQTSTLKESNVESPPIFLSQQSIRFQWLSSTVIRISSAQLIRPNGSCKELVEWFMA